MSLQVQPTNGASAGLAYADTEPLGVATVGDPATALLALILQSRGAQSDAAGADVEHANRVIEQTRQAVRDAMKRAAEAQEHSGFWNKISQVFDGDIGALCEAVAAVAVTAATGGLGAPAIFAISAALLSIGGDIAHRTGLDPKICLGLSAASALAGLAVGNLGNAPAIWSTLAKGSELTHIAATGAGAGATAGSTMYHADSLEAQADATAARSLQSEAIFDFNLALDAIDHAARDMSRAESTASNIVQSENDGRTALIARLGAA